MFIKVSIIVNVLYIGFLESEGVSCSSLRVRAFYLATYRYIILQIDPGLLPYHVSDDREIMGIENPRT
jgi:hypothetical protein